MRKGQLIPKYHNGYRRQRPSQGEMITSNRVINCLPAVGEVVVIEEIIFFDNVPQYQLCQSRMDAWARPRLYTVHGYTHGIEEALNPNNKMVCSYCVGNVELMQCISVLPITTGSMRTVKASPQKLKMWRYL